MKFVIRMRLMSRLCGVFAVMTCSAWASDWPMWRHDSLRSAYTPQTLPDNLHLHWVRELPPPQRAWPWQADDFEKLAFDESYEPVAAGGLLYLPSMVTDCVTAYDIETGAEQWRYVTDGPVRLAPMIWEDRLYVVSDDGALHCLNAASGERIWRFQAAPSNRSVLGNRRIISMWPVRGGPVIQDGVIYFTAGIWPHEGVYIYALDARTAELKWVNSASSSDIMRDAKGYASFGGIAPQGHLAIQGDRLFVSGGRTPPAVFDTETGYQLYYHASGRAGSGGHTVFVRGDWYFNSRDRRTTHMYSVIDGGGYGALKVDLTTEEAWFGVHPDSGRITAYATDPKETKEPPEPTFDRMGRPMADETRSATRTYRPWSRSRLSDFYQLETLWESDPVEGLERLHVKAGHTLYGSGPNGRVFSIAVPPGSEEPKVTWTYTVEGEVFNMIAAQGRLIVVTVEGHVYAFGSGSRDIVTHAYEAIRQEQADDEWGRRAEQVLASVDSRGGYGVMFGIGSGRLLEEVLSRSDLHMTVYDLDPDKVAKFRNQFLRAGWYGTRVAVHEGDRSTVRLPPYIASLVLSEDPRAAGLDDGADFARFLYHPLRPYGGVAVVHVAGAEQDAFARAVETAGLERAELLRYGGYVQLIRPGPLPGSGQWTHQYADVGNSAYSPEERVRAPLGIVWFGGEPNHKTLPRHMHGPIPQVVAGRLLIMGPHHVSARCVYTGVELWSRELPMVGANFTDFEYEEALVRDGHAYFPGAQGANNIGSPIATAEDAVYVIHEDQCLRLDLATGETLATFTLPDWAALKSFGVDEYTRDDTKSYGTQLGDGEVTWSHSGTDHRAPLDGERPAWGHARYYGDYLIVAAYPHIFDELRPGRDRSYNAMSSEFLVVMDRHTGEIKWTQQARYGFRHNAIVAGSGRIYVIDDIPRRISQQLSRRGITPEVSREIRAMDVATGKLLWSTTRAVFGTFLGYSQPHDLLFQSGHGGHQRTVMNDPRDRVAALKGETGALLWDKSPTQRRSPFGLHPELGQLLLGSREGALDMFTGEPVHQEHPMTGGSEPWQWVGALRCGTQNFSRHLITFRSGALGFADLLGRAMTANIPGAKAGCSNNMIAGDGLLNVPDYTRSCSCSYQLQTSLALAYLPEAEMWTYSEFTEPEAGSVRRAGINFGAPGARLDRESDVLWTEYPPLVDPNPRVGVEIEIAEDGQWFRNHASWIHEGGNAHPWVVASGIEGIRQIDVALGAKDEQDARAYDVVLYFAEPWDLSAGERTFNVLIQGRKVLDAYDVVEHAGGARRGRRVVFRNVPVKDFLRIAFEWPEGARPAVISGVEIHSRFPAASIADVRAVRADQFHVTVNNHLESSDLTFDVELNVDGAKATSGSITVQPGEQGTVPLELEAPLTGKRNIQALVKTSQPPKLTGGDALMDFDAMRRALTFDLDAYAKVFPKPDGVRVDGDLSSWEGVSPVAVLQNQADIVPANQRANWQGPDDLSATLYLAWGQEHLYIAASVVDDQHFNHSDSEELWNGDSLQFGLDPLREGVLAFNLGVALASGEVQTFQWFGPHTGATEQGEFVVKRDDDKGHTFYEFRIPMKTLALNPVKGELLAFSAIVFDDDHGEGQEYRMEMTPGVAGGWNPAEFNKYVFWDGSDR